MQINLPLFPEQGKRGVMIALLVILAFAAAGLGYKLFFYRAPATGIYQPAKPADGMANAPTHETKPIKLVAYDKDKAVKIMGIPEIILQDPKLELVATSRTKKDRDGYSTTSAAITNAETGKTQIIEKTERSIFSFGGRTEIGARGGIGTHGYAGAVYARQDLLRVGNVHLAGYGEAGASALRDPEAKAMIDLSVRW